MLKNTVYLVAAAIIALLIYQYPRLTVNPGKLLSGHVKYENDCLECHTPFLGVPGEKCINCHKPEEIAKKIIEKKKERKKEQVDFHGSLGAESCLSCHFDHVGLESDKSIRKFSHQILSQKEREQCTICHQTPKDKAHEQFAGTCQDCHNTQRWKPAEFNHEKYFQRLSQSERKNCVKCHTTPADSLHKELGESCSQCHNTKKWKPADFEHEKYFRFDRHHPSDCKSCHPTDNYKQYSCYECHEHSPAGMERKHRKEGIRDYDVCVKCHRSGNEHEAERIWKSGRIYDSNNKSLPSSTGTWEKIRRQSRGTRFQTGEREYRRYEQRRSRREHDDDDDDDD